MTQPITLLMTRPYAASVRFVGQLPDRVQARVNTCYSPLIRITPLVERIPLGDTTALIFTSSNAVELASMLTKDRSMPAYCVGTATTQAAREAGWKAQFCGATSEKMIETLTTLRPDRPILHLAGVHTRNAISERLSSIGIKTSSFAIYDQITENFTKQAIDVLNSSIPVIAPLFSPRTARQFASQIPENAPIWLAALSDEVAKPLKSLNYHKLMICDQPDAKTMCKNIEFLVNAAGRVETSPSAK